MATRHGKDQPGGITTRKGKVVYERPVHRRDFAAAIRMLHGSVWPDYPSERLSSYYATTEHGESLLNELLQLAINVRRALQYYSTNPTKHPFPPQQGKKAIRIILNTISECFSIFKTFPDGVDYGMWRLLKRLIRTYIPQLAWIIDAVEQFLEEEEEE
jgi:hypothetical protein